jgi:hypothetical protein
LTGDTGLVNEWTPMKWIEQNISRFKDQDIAWASRRRALLNEISSQEQVVENFASSSPVDIPGQKIAVQYLAALRSVEAEITGDAKAKGWKISEEEEIYWHFYHAVVAERAGRTPAPVDLASLYQEFRSKYFDNLVPELSIDFVCTFSRLPFDLAGACCLEKEAAQLGVKKGIRINEKLREFPAEVKVALLHEMVHAKGIRGHGTDLKTELTELFSKGAYLDPLIF